MLGFEFKSKLARLNPRLFVDDTSARQVNEEWKTSALCLRVHKHSRGQTAGEYSQLAADARKYLEATDQGMLPEFICGVPTGWIPENDVFDSETGKLLARGWRSTLLTLSRRGVITLVRARHVFSCGSLGESDYDKLPVEARARLAVGTKKSAKQLISEAMSHAV